MSKQFAKGTVARDEDTATISLASTNSISRVSSGDRTGSTSAASYATSTNIWAKLIGTTDSVWDGLDGREDVYDDRDTDEADDDLVTVKSRGYEDEGICGTTPLKVWCIGMWYETRHFFRTLGKHPVIILVSLVVFGLVCGLGLWAVQSERDSYVKDRMDTAKFVVSLLILFLFIVYFVMFVLLYFRRAILVLFGERGEIYLMCSN